jgi:hypothetical protein
MRFWPDTSAFCSDNPAAGAKLARRSLADRACAVTAEMRADSVLAEKPPSEECVVPEGRVLRSTVSPSLDHGFL